MILWFQRLRRLFSKNGESHEQSASDPVEMADELLQDMERELNDMQASLNKQIASEKRLNRRMELAEEESSQREKDAIQFLEKDDDQSAKLALLKKEEIDRDIQEITSLFESAQAHKQDILRHIDEQRRDYQRLQIKKRELQSKRNLHLPSAVDEMERAKKRDHEMSGDASFSEKNEHEGESNVGEENERSSSESVDAKLEHLKKSLKNRN
ncbi:PspA/IM30 family protein [Salipaludibacillus daqingensis]|uniref:PspA/IM30 family protein n=1 Tax=Salipaludibacillus daqingensis TaxID=3041001 RepID=UPI002473C17A|nr:PspA/IM30 family protein [Salipaludibacillus daqingensis]